MDTFQGRLREALIKSINSKNTPVVGNFEKAGFVNEVPEESNAEIETPEVLEDSDVEMIAIEKLAQGLVDYAMNQDLKYAWDSDENSYAFQNLPELSDEEFIELARSAIGQGYSWIKSDLRWRVGSLSEESSKFLDDVYKLAMKKLDDLAEQVRKGEPLKSRDADLANQRLLNTGNK